MSTKMYNELFESVKFRLQQLLKTEAPKEPPPPPVTDRQVAVTTAAERYLSYVGIAKDLNDCYENIVHVQRRQMIRPLLDGVIGRALELKEELVVLEKMDVLFLDHMMISHKMEPKDVDLPLPPSFREKSEFEMEKDDWISASLQYAATGGDIDDHFLWDVSDEQIYEEKVEAAVQLIQKHERARQFRCHFQLLQADRKREEEEQLKFAKKRAKPTANEQEDAAIIIEKTLKGFCARNRIESLRNEESVFLKMFPSDPSSREDTFKAVQAIAEQRLELRIQQEEQYDQVVKHIRKKIESDKIPVMEEQLEEDTRDYFHVYNASKDAFPEFPPDEAGGSSVFFPPSPEKDDEGDQVEEVTETANKGKEVKETAKGGDKDKGKKDSKAPETDYSLKPSNYIPDLIDRMKEYTRTWDRPKGSVRKKADFKFNPETYDPVSSQQLHCDDPDESLIEKELTEEYWVTVRQKVDQIMRDELMILNKSLEKDKGKKGGKKGKGKGGKKKGKGKGKGKGGKKKGGKKEKDITATSTLESLFDELIDANILKDYPRVQLSEIIGNYNCYGSVIQREYKRDPDPCIGDIKREVKEACILPMMSAAIHAKGPFTKSVLFVGPSNVGKKMFVHAICTEIGAILFDLSAVNIEGKYPGKTGLTMLMHLMSKVGRVVQPTVIFIEDAEKTFMKKVPKSDTSDPKRLKKDLPKLLKSIKGEDRILLIGTTKTPFDADLKGLGSCYQKIFYIPPPDHNCRHTLWQELIVAYGGRVSPYLDLSSLCSISDGFTAFHFKCILEKILTRRRISSLKKFPLVLKEFTLLLSEHTPIYNEERQAYKDWLSKMPLYKKRRIMLEDETTNQTAAPKGKKK